MLGKELMYSMPTPFYPDPPFLSMSQALSLIHFLKQLLFSLQTPLKCHFLPETFLTLSASSDAQPLPSSPQPLKVAYPKHIFMDILYLESIYFLIYS